jgi:hypothetical protein
MLIFGDGEMMRAHLYNVYKNNGKHFAESYAFWSRCWLRISVASKVQFTGLGEVLLGTITVDKFCYITDAVLLDLTEICED